MNAKGVGFFLIDILIEMMYFFIYNSILGNDMNESVLFFTENNLENLIFIKKS